MGALKDWVDQDWVRVGTDGKIKGKCGTSKDKKTQIVVCLAVKRKVYLKKNVHPPLKRKSVREQKVKLWFPILKKQKFGI